MSRGVIYMLYGSKHTIQLVVSLYSLRMVWDGPVALLAGHDEHDSTSLRLGELIAADDRLDVQVIPFPFTKKHRRSNGYYNKTRMYLQTPFDNSVFFDADTLIVGRFDEMFSLQHEVVLTQFADWWSNGGRVKRRVENWRKIDGGLVDRMVKDRYPAINTGVMGFHRETEFMLPWQELTARNISFICDEIAAQLIFPDYPCRVLDHRWNASVIYSSGHEEVKKDVRVWHGHGSKFFRKPSGRRIWRPWYDECVRQNIARLADWTPYRADDPMEHNLRCSTFTN